LANSGFRSESGRPTHTVPCSTLADADALVDEVVAVGRELTRSS
jgi:hypothetical protein